MRSPEPQDKPAAEFSRPEPGQAVTTRRRQPEESLAQMPLGSLLYHVLFGGLWGSVES